MKTILIVLAPALLLIVGGCASTPIQRRASVDVTTTKVPLSCAIIVDKALCAPNAETVEWHGINAAAYPHFDLSADIITNSVSVLGGVFTSAALVSPTAANLDADIGVRPVVLSAEGKANGWTAWANCTFAVKIEMFFLDQQQAPIFYLVSSGEATSRVGTSFVYMSRGEQRACDAVYNAMQSLASGLPSNDKLKFVVSHQEFFRMDDTGMAKHLQEVLTPDSNEQVGDMLLGYAVRANRLQLLDGLLEHGVSVNTASDDDGLTPLHWAAIYDNGPAISRLVAAGANINQRDILGHLPIYYAVWNRNLDARNALLDGNTALDVVNEDDLLTSAELIEECGDHYAAKKQAGHARTCYQMARDTASEAMTEYASSIRKINQQEFWRFVVISMLAVASDSLQAYSANVQWRGNAQINALRYASQSGTGMAGYSTAYGDYLKNFHPVGTVNYSYSATMNEDASLDVKKESFESLKKSAQETLVRLNSKLALPN